MTKHIERTPPEDMSFRASQEKNVARHILFFVTDNPEHNSGTFVAAIP
jgi:hypothetical protein